MTLALLPRSAFFPYDYFIVKHAVASNDVRGDQGHFGPPFMSFHRLIMTEMENTFLAVIRARNSVPLVDAWPYWDPSLDSDVGGACTATGCAPGAYFNADTFDNQDSKNIFSATYFGSYDGNASVGFAVTDGAFAYWPVVSDPHSAVSCEQRMG